VLRDSKSLFLVGHFPFLIFHFREMLFALSACKRIQMENEKWKITNDK